MGRGRKIKQLGNGRGSLRGEGKTTRKKAEGAMVKGVTRERDMKKNSKGGWGFFLLEYRRERERERSRG